MWSGLSVAWTDLQIRLAFVVLAIYLLLRISLVSNVISDLGIDPELLDEAVLVPIIVTLILWQTVQITKQLTDVQGSVVPGRTSGEIQQLLPDLIRETGGKNRVLHIVGISLRDSWSDLRQRLDARELDGWTVHLAAYTGSDSFSGAPTRWADHGKQFLAEALEYSQRPALKRRGTQLYVYEYKHAPAIHGYLLGSGEAFVSILQWKSDGKFFSGGPHVYEHIKAGDTSISAKSKLSLMRSWVRASQRTPLQPPQSAD